MNARREDFGDILIDHGLTFNELTQFITEAKFGRFNGKGTTEESPEGELYKFSSGGIVYEEVAEGIEFKQQSGIERVTINYNLVWRGSYHNFFSIPPSHAKDPETFRKGFDEAFDKFIEKATVGFPISTQKGIVINNSYGTYLYTSHFKGNLQHFGAKAKILYKWKTGNQVELENIVFDQVSSGGLTVNY